MKQNPFQIQGIRKRLSLINSKENLAESYIIFDISLLSRYYIIIVSYIIITMINFTLIGFDYINEYMIIYCFKISVKLKFQSIYKKIWNKKYRILNNINGINTKTFALSLRVSFLVFFSLFSSSIFWLLTWIRL